MKIKEQDYIKSFEDCFSDIPFIRARCSNQQVVTEEGNFRPDLFCELQSPQRTTVALVEIKYLGQPRLARDAVNQLLRYLKAMPDAYGIFMAPYISPAAALVCREEGIGYIDLADNCWISFDQVFIQKEGKPNPFSERRELKTLFSAKAERVLRVLLTSYGKPWKMQKLADEAKVSIGLVSNVKRLLLEREWISEEKMGFSLVDPEALLKKWKENYQFKRNRVREYYGFEETSKQEFDLAEIFNASNIRYAFTGFSGAARYAPAVRSYQRASIYIQWDETITDILSIMKLKPVDSGSTLRVIEPHDDGVFYNSLKVNGISVATPVQVYLDLKSERGRSEEAADLLLEEVIREKW